MDCSPPGSYVHGFFQTKILEWVAVSYSRGSSQLRDQTRVSYVFWGFPDSSVGKESACDAGDPSSISGLGRSPGEGIGYPLQYSWASLVAQQVRNPPAMQETWVWSLGWEDPLEKGKATHSSILAWRFHGLYSPWGCTELDTTERLSLSLMSSALAGEFFATSAPWEAPICNISAC